MTKFYVDFPSGAVAGYGGRHHFFTRSEGQAFLERAHQRGATDHGALTPSKK